MKAMLRGRLVLLCFMLALMSLMGLFAILNASTADARQKNLTPVINNQPAIIITPTELNASLFTGELFTQTLWITNTTDNPITFTIYEMTAPLPLATDNLTPSANPQVDPEVQDQLATQGSAYVIISLREQPDLSQAFMFPNKLTRREYVYQRLLEIATHSQDLYDWLDAQGTNPKRLLAAGAIAANLNASQLAKLVTNPQIRQIRLNQQFSIIAEQLAVPIGPQPPSEPTEKLSTIEWNILKIHADKAWNTLGITGEGAVVGIIDTGVMYDHPALINSYRGNLGGGDFDHNYNWFDFVSDQPVPYDDNGHGTRGVGIISGDDGGNNQIGVAPGAKWIATKGCTAGGACSDAALLESLEWMLAPTDLNGQNPDPTRAPDVVLGMWGGMGCDDFFEPSLLALRAAGILPVFSPGGSGPSCSTIGSPADSATVISAGATDQNDVIFQGSSRGPTCYDTIKPDLSAPGVDIRTSDNNGDYDITTGTSWSAAHTAGAAAMVISADPSLSVSEVSDILFTTALCIDDDQCEGGTCPEPNNVYGHGRIDVYEAVYAALGSLPPVNLPWLSEQPISGTLGVGEGIAISVTFDSSGLDPATYTGALGIYSDDPEQPFSFLPVTLEVLNPPVPAIAFDPSSFSTTLPIGGVLTDTLTISNQGDATLTFTLYEISRTKRIFSTTMKLELPDLYPASTPTRVDAAVHTQLLFLGQTRLIFYLRGQADLSAASQVDERAERGQYVYNQLLKLASQSDDLYQWLFNQGAQPRRLLTANAIAATLDEQQLKAALAYPQVGRVTVNRYGHIIDDEAPAMDNLHSLLNTPNSVEWNIAKIRADETWTTFGITGQGATVGIIDTGVMYDHPALINAYRGNLGDGSFDHNYNWYDLVNGQDTPYDDHGHGTFGAGIVVGDDGGDNQIGVAPGAKWIAVKAISSGGGVTEEQLHDALAWMLAPTDLDGNNPDPSQAPQLVLNMWFWSLCEPTFEADLIALSAANILPVFAPEMLSNCQVNPPAASAYALSAGSTDVNDFISPFSSYGPSCFDETLIKPDLAAPGVEIRSSTIDGGYDTWSGTSFSTAHLAGAAALLYSADPQFSISQLKQSLFDTAVCYDDSLYCGGDPCPGANNTYGYGRIDVFEAVSTTLGAPYDLPWLIAGPLTAEIPPGDNMQVIITFTAEDQLPGTYTGGIAVESNDPQAPFTSLPVALTVTAPCQPITDLTVDYTPHQARSGEVITFTASATGTLPITYTWSIGDLIIGTGEQVTHTFESVGIYLVTLSVENPCSGPLSVHLPVTIYEPKRTMLPVIMKQE